MSTTEANNKTQILVTGGTVFVSRFIAEYYVAKGYEVYVLNRNNKQQSDGVKLIQADRHALGEVLRSYFFDAVIDVAAYTGEDIRHLLDALGSYGEYVFISSSAVYPEYAPQPFKEDEQTAPNKFWGKYGTDKIEAETVLMQRNPDAYILRPPYLYGPMNNVYREAFVFDCAMQERKFYLPKDGELKLQFFHVEDLCRFIDSILEKKPAQHIFNVGNKEAVSVYDWAQMCYDIVGRPLDVVKVFDDIEQRNYFSFYDYEYYLDVTKQYELMESVKPLKEGLKESYDWYVENQDKVNKKSFFDFIDKNI